MDVWIPHVGSILEPEPIPFHLTGLSGNTAPIIESSGYAERAYQYSLNDQQYSLLVNIPDVLFNYYEARERMPNRGVFVADPYQHDYLGEIATQFEQVGESNFDVVNHAMSFVQQLEYTTDEVATGIRQYTYYPLETLNDAGGDCEDTAILLAGLLQEIGYGCVLLAFWNEQHIALGVAGEESIPATSQFSRFFEDSLFGRNSVALSNRSQLKFARPISIGRRPTSKAVQIREGIFQLNRR